MSGLIRVPMSGGFSSKMVLVLSPSDMIAEAMPRGQVANIDNYTVFIMRFTDVPRPGEYISLSGLLHKVTEVEWIESEDSENPCHPLLTVEEVEDGGITVPSSLVTVPNGCRLSPEEAG